MPFLMLDYWAWDMSFNGVLINNADSARIAVEYLIKKGHTEIGYLQGNFRIKAFRSRAVGYATYLAEKRFRGKEGICGNSSTTMNGAYKDMLEYLKQKPKLPTAFFADNDMIALGAMKALQEMGYRIPEDVSIVGFDDLPFSEISNPPLTIIKITEQEMGRLAVRELVEVINGNAKIKRRKHRFAQRLLSGQV